MKAVLYVANRLKAFLIFNLLLLLLLYIIPVQSKFLENICLFKLLTGHECWNCGMTRAFLSVLHFDFCGAYEYNHNIIIIFPLTVFIYLYSWYKYIFMKGGNNS